MWNSIGNYHCRYQTKYSPSLSKLSGAYFFLSPKYPQQSHSTLHPKVNSTMIWWKVMPTSSGGKCKNRVIMLTIFTIKSHALVSRPSQKEQPRRQTHTPIHTQIMELNEDKLIMNNTKAVATTSKLWLNRNSYIWFFCHLLAFTQELTCTRSWNRTSKEVEVTIITQGKHSRRKLALKHLSLSVPLTLAAVLRSRGLIRIVSHRPLRRILDNITTAPAQHSQRPQSQHSQRPQSQHSQRPQSQHSHSTPMVGKLGYLTPSFKDAEEKEPTAYGENRGPLARGEGYVHVTQYHGFIYSVQFLQHVRDHFPSSGLRKTSFRFPASKPQGSQHFKCPVCKQNSYNGGLFLHCNCCDSITCLTSVPIKVCLKKIIKCHTRNCSPIKYILLKSS